MKFYQYTRAINHIATVPDVQGRLMVKVHQVRTLGQTWLSVIQGLSRACEFYAKLL